MEKTGQHTGKLEKKNDFVFNNVWENPERKKTCLILFLLLKTL